MTVATPPDSDPRIAPAEAGVLPVVARARSGPPGWVLVLVAIGIGIVLFVALDARRRSLSAPAIRPRVAEALSAPSLVSPLYVPPVAEPQQPAPQFAPAPLPSPAPQPMQRILPQPAQPYVPQQSYVAPQPSQPAAPPARIAAEPMLVIDTTSGPAATGSAEGPASTGNSAPTGRSAITGTRTGAGVLANKATTVPLGTLIPAVLETALDSTSPGLARALVSRDIRGFDGSRILIPRGSRLIGEYGSDTQSGQKRMLVNWTRLVRPDGVTIAINSPATDPLGQGGIRASVNSHFFERFAGAILQSALDVGVNLASRAADSQVIVALPGTIGASVNGGRAASPAQIKPTLKVKAATSISIFVARDLDFTGVENR